MYFPRLDFPLGDRSLKFPCLVATGRYRGGGQAGAKKCPCSMVGARRGRAAYDLERRRRYSAAFA